jgi:hypothetical protein
VGRGILRGTGTLDPLGGALSVGRFLRAAEFDGDPTSVRERDPDHHAESSDHEEHLSHRRSEVPLTPEVQLVPELGAERRVTRKPSRLLASCHGPSWMKARPWYPSPQVPG